MHSIIMDHPRISCIDESLVLFLKMLKSLKTVLSPNYFVYVRLEFGPLGRQRFDGNYDNDFDADEHHDYANGQCNDDADGDGEDPNSRTCVGGEKKLD